MKQRSLNINREPFHNVSNHRPLIMQRNHSRTGLENRLPLSRRSQLCPSSASAEGRFGDKVICAPRVAQRRALKAKLKENKAV